MLVKLPTTVAFNEVKCFVSLLQLRYCHFRVVIRFTKCKSDVLCQISATAFFSYSEKKLKSHCSTYTEWWLSVLSYNDIRYWHKELASFYNNEN